jgi:pimeloyl-ACP methyl ester carboxylesterase
VTLKDAVAEQSPRYGEIRVPTVVISGSADNSVTTDIHSRPFAKAAGDVKLIVLPDIGHAIPNAVPDLVVAEIEAMIGRLSRREPAPAINA